MIRCGPYVIICYHTWTKCDHIWSISDQIRSMYDPKAVATVSSEKVETVPPRVSPAPPPTKKKTQKNTTWRMPHGLAFARAAVKTELAK